MSTDFVEELASYASNVSAAQRTQKLTTGELSYAIFQDLGIFCFLFIQKWNECKFFGGTLFLSLKDVLSVRNTKTNHGRTVSWPRLHIRNHT
jgi:hypothetical protein